MGERKKVVPTKTVPGYQPEVTEIDEADVLAYTKFGGWNGRAWTPFEFKKADKGSSSLKRADGEPCDLSAEIAVLDAFALAVERGAFPASAYEGEVPLLMFKTKADAEAFCDRLEAEQEFFWVTDRHFRALFHVFENEEQTTTYPAIADYIRSML